MSANVLIYYIQTYLLVARALVAAKSFILPLEMYASEQALSSSVQIMFHALPFSGTHDFCLILSHHLSFDTYCVTTKTPTALVGVYCIAQKYHYWSSVDWLGLICGDGGMPKVTFIIPDQSRSSFFLYLSSLVVKNVSKVLSLPFTIFFACACLALTNGCDIA